MGPIHPEMKVSEAVKHRAPVEQYSLKRWVEMADPRLCDLRPGDICKYQIDRLKEVDLHQVNSEVSIVLRLLENAGVGEEIRKTYRPLRKPDELSHEERLALPEQAQRYIEKLENELRGLQSEYWETKDRLRRANWAKWSRG